MSDDNKTYWTDDPELVEKYVLGRLTDEERQRLDAEIADCEPCKQKLRHELEMAAGIRRYGRDSLKAKLHSRLRKKQSNQMQQFQLIGLAAAVVIIAIGVGVYKIWFEDFSFPKKFGRREIVLQQAEQPKDSSRSQIESRQADGEQRLAEEMDSKSETVAASETPSSSGPKDIAEIKSDRSDKGTGMQSGSGKLKKKESSALPNAVLRDESSTIKESAGTMSTAESKKVDNRPARIYKEQTIWLMGEVVMVSDASPQSASKIVQQERQSERFLANEEGVEKKSASRVDRQSRTVTVKRGEEEEQIVLQQRPFHELPVKRQTNLGKKNHVETLLEQSRTGSLSLTIFSDALTADELESATVETANNDSLIISTPSQRIYYRLPAELSSQRSSQR